MAQEGDIPREAVTAAITNLMRSYLVRLDDYSGRLQRGEDPELWTLEIEKTEEGFFTLMRLAIDLGLYEEVDRRIVIPRSAKDGL